jgi:hypothetical protein
MKYYLWVKNCKYGDDAKLKKLYLIMLCKQNLYLINSTKKDDDDDDDDNNNINMQHIYNFRQ